MGSSNHAVSLIGGLLLGAMAGAALGVLFAPHKGSKTRSNIIDGAKEAVYDVQKKMKKEVKAMRRKARNIENATKDKIDDMKDSIKDTIKAKAEAL